MVSKELNEIGYYFVVADNSKCIDCGICVSYCPDFALRVEKGNKKKNG